MYLSKMKSWENSEQSAIKENDFVVCIALGASWNESSIEGNAGVEIVLPHWSILQPYIIQQLLLSFIIWIQFPATI